MDQYLIVQTGFIAKNQILSICPAHILILNLPHICKGNIQIDFYDDRSLKFYLKITRPYRQIKLDYFYQLEANKVFLNPLFRDGF